MRRYFANRNLRRLRYLDNPEDDSFIDAFNKYNEQPANMYTRSKRETEQKAFPTQAEMLKFEISDAVEPSDELKAIIRQHRSRELNTTHLDASLNQNLMITSVSPHTTTGKLRIQKIVRTIKKPAQKTETRKRAARSKRATLEQPADFKVKFIPFSIDDAREPDEVTKQLIKRSRMLEPEQPKSTKIPEKTSNHAGENRTGNLKTKIQLNRSSKLKRAKRSVSKKQPEVFKFKIEDAKEPNESMKRFLQQQQMRRNNTLEEGRPKTEKTVITSTATEATDLKNPKEDPDSGTDSNDNEDDESSVQLGHESRRSYIYKEAPKTRKSINSLPQEVQKVISHLLTGHENGKAHIKYIPENQMGYSNSKMINHGYGSKLKAANAYSQHSMLAQKVDPLIHSVPAVEKFRFVYTPAIPSNTEFAQIFSPPKHSMQQPIVVKDIKTPPPQQPEEIYHSYASDLSRINNQNQNDNIKAEAIKDVPPPRFRPSKSDPVLDENKLGESYIHSTSITPIDNLTYELLSYGTEPHGYYHAYAKPHIQLLSQAHPELEKYKHSIATTAPVINIEYHASSDNADVNYKDLQEFKELSTLMGKSLEDQIHGLTYLLAKEMQNKLQRQSKMLNANQRPQDSTSPILFHPKQQLSLPRQHNTIKIGSGRLFGLGKVKEYVPIVEEIALAEQTKAPKTDSLETANETTEKESEGKHPLEYDSLSPNYEMAPKNEPTLVLEHLVHHPSSSKEHHQATAVSKDNIDVQRDTGLNFGDKRVRYGVHHSHHDDTI